MATKTSNFPRTVISVIPTFSTLFEFTMSGDRIYIDLNGIMARIRERVTERGAVGIRGLGRLFRIADDDGSRAIDLHNELPKLLADIGVFLNRTEVSELGRMLDRNGDGQITYDEFLFYFAPPMNQFRTDLVTRTFDFLDKNGNGVLELEDLRGACPQATVPAGTVKRVSASQQMFQNLLTTFDKNGDGTISKQEFIDYYREQSPNIDNDEHFEMLITRAWGLPQAQ